MSGFWDKVRGSISIVESVLYALYIADLVWFEDVCHIKKKLQVRGRFSLIPIVAQQMQLPSGARDSCRGLLDSWICFFVPLVTCHLSHSSQSYNFPLAIL